MVWDEAKNETVIYDPDSGAYARDNVRPALFGTRTLRSKDGNEITCQPVFERLGEIAAEFAPEKSEKITWVPAEQVWQTALMLAHNRPLSMYMWNGVGQHTNATQTSRAIASLYALLGDFDRQGGNVTFPKLPTNNVDGKEFLSKEAAALRIGREKKPLGPPASPGNCAAYDIFTAIIDEQPYPIKAFLAFGCNPVMSNPDPRRAREALSKLDFAVAMDLFMTPTADAMRLCLAGDQFSRDVRHHHRVRTSTSRQDPPAIPRRYVVEPLYERRSDTWILFELAKRMGMSEQFFNGDIEAGFAYELATDWNHTGRIEERSRRHFPSRGADASRNMPRQIRTDDRAASPRRRNESNSTATSSPPHGYPALPEYIEPALSPVSRPDIAADFPLVLTNAKNTTFVHSQHRSLTSLRKALPEPSADIHPETALRYGIKNKEWMTVETPKGAIKVKARVTTNIVPGAVCVQHGWWQGCKELELPGYDAYDSTGANAAMLIGTDLADPISGSLPHRSYLCRVRPAT